jgi:hypothetical protein
LSRVNKNGMHPSPCLLVMPGLVGESQTSITEMMCTSPGWPPSRGEYLLDTILLSGAPGLSDELDEDAIFIGEPFRVLPDEVSVRLGESRVIEDTDLASAQVFDHPRSITHLRQSALDDNPVVAGNDALNPVFVSRDQRGHLPPSAFRFC